MTSDFKQMLLLKIPVKQGIIVEGEDYKVLIELKRRRNARGYFISW
jgi:hypothetical protein